MMNQNLSRNLITQALNTNIVFLWRIRHDIVNITQMKREYYTNGNMTQMSFRDLWLLYMIREVRDEVVLVSTVTSTFH